jgi:hypothetical protein
MTPKDAVPVSPFKAFHDVVHAYGVRDLAEQLGMRAGTLWNKADADVDSHHQPTLRDVIAVTRHTDDFRVVESLNRLFNKASFSLASGPVSDEALLELLARIGCEKGQMYQALLSGYADRRFCREDFAVVRAEAFDVITAVLNFIVRAEGLIDE